VLPEWKKEDKKRFHVTRFEKTIFSTFLLQNGSDNLQQRAKNELKFLEAYGKMTPNLYILYYFKIILFFLKILKVLNNILNFQNFCSR
jgi:hypothetical protein